MTYRIYLSPPDIGSLEEEYVLDALRSGWVAPLGPHVEALEREIAGQAGVAHAVALSSGTAGLHLGLLALGVRAGDEVVVPTMTFAATAFAVTYVGAQPVFLDSEPDSVNLDPDLLAAFLSERAAAGSLPAAVIVVDIYGQTADYDRILPLCQEYGVPVLEDAAEALGATHRLGRAGSFGRAAVFSFNGNKIMTTSGGMLVTDDGAIAARVRHLATQAREPVPWYEHEEIGFNYRMSNLLAALGRAQLQRLPGMIEHRRSTFELYAKHLTAPGVRMLHDAPWGAGNHWLSLVVFDDPGSAARVITALDNEGIESRHTWKPMHLQPCFASATSLCNGVAEALFDNGVCLPSGSALDSADAELIAALVLDAAAGSGGADDVSAPDRTAPQALREAAARTRAARST
jgi:dTDP-4-amino-4,6-dideoxygalactose transaminase